MFVEIYRPLFVCFTIQLSYYSRSVVFSSVVLLICALVGFKHPEENSFVLEICAFLINYAIGLVCFLLYCTLYLKVTIEKLWYYEFEALDWLLHLREKSAAQQQEASYFSIIYAFLIFFVTFLCTEALHFGSGGIVWKASCIRAVLLIQTVAWLFELFASDPEKADTTTAPATKKSGLFKVRPIEHLLLGVIFCNLLTIDVMFSQPPTRTALYFAIVGGFMVFQILLNVVFKRDVVRKQASALI